MDPVPQTKTLRGKGVEMLRSVFQKKRWSESWPAPLLVLRASQQSELCFHQPPGTSTVRAEPGGGDSGVSILNWL